jgi:PAS domain S-box-containing protein
MSMPIRPHARIDAQFFASASGGAAILLGGLVLLGWAFNVSVLKSVIPGRTAMNPGGTALAFLLAGLSLWTLADETTSLHRRALGIACSVAVILIGLARLGGYVAEWDGGPDQLLFREALERESLQLGQPNRMAPNTAAAFVLVALALALLDVETRHRIRPAQLLALATGLIALLALIGYAYSAITLIGVRRFVPMALNTALGFSVLSAGILCARPGRGLMSVVASQGAGGAMARRLLPAALLIPAAVGWLSSIAQQRGAIDNVTGLSCFVLANILIFTTLIWWNAASLDRMDRERTLAERRLGIQHTTTGVLAESPELNDALPRILEATCESLGWAFGAAWWVDSRAKVLRCGDLWHAKSTRLDEFEALCRRTTFLPGIGLPGRVWETGQPSWIPDVVTDPNFPRAPAAARGGLHGAFGFPIVFDDDILGVIEVMSGEIQKPDEELLRMLAAIGSQIGQFMKRKQAEDAVLHERSLLVALLDTVPDSIYFKDAEGRFRRISRALGDRFGLADPADAFGKTDFDFFTEEHARQAMEDEQEILRTGRPVIAKVEVETWEDGHVSWVSTTKLPLRDNQGRIIGTFGISRDINALKRAEEVLRQQEERFRSLVEATVAIVWNTPASGEFETEQPGWSDFTGQTFEELKGWGWLDAVHPDDRQHTARVWSAATAARALYQVEHRLRRHDGEYRHMFVRAVPLLGKGGAIREWVGVHTDVDAEKRAEASMREAKEAAEAATRTKSEFLANMSHEIRTPLNGIIGMTDLALDTELTPDQREYLGMVKGSAEHLLNVINDILDFSKIEAGKLDLEHVDFDVRDTLDDTVATLAMRAHRKGLELADHVAADVPDALVGDPHRLRQVVVNLIGNAIKFTERGEVVLRAEVKSRTDEGVCLHFAVSDTGIGITPEQQQKLFKAFSQADTSTTRKYGGTGLGLAISARLVQIMGGEIWLDSQAGKGSTFHFTVPFGLARLPVARPAPAEPIQVHGLPVLVVDDNATNRRILQELLANWGMIPTLVESGGGALAALERARAAGEPFALVLLDAMMPEMDGFALAEQIGGDSNPDAPTPTLMMLSSANRREDAARCRDLAVAAYLTKPVKQSTLLDAIMTALGSSAVAECHADAKTSLPATVGPHRALRLLLAEDNAVNQHLAVSLLERRGHQVVVTENGREALDALDEQSFDAVLMDVQMPEMDGFETTAAIRAKEAETGGYTWIVAMTAHALKGDKERCLEAGMDAYVTKPLRAQELYSVVEGLAPWAAKPPPKMAERTPTAPALDLTAALERVEGDTALLRELAGLFLEECPLRISLIRDAITQRNHLKLQQEAHTLKGSVSNFAARPAAEAAKRLETAGRELDWARAEAAFAALEAALGRLEPALAEIGQAKLS